MYILVCNLKVVLVGMIHCFFLISRHGRSRLTKWYSSNLSQMEKQRFLKEVHKNWQRWTNWWLHVNPKCATLLTTSNTKSYTNVMQAYISSRLWTRTITSSSLLNSFTHLWRSWINTLAMSVNLTSFLISIKYHSHLCQTYFIIDELLIAGYVSESNRKSILKDL